MRLKEIAQPKPFLTTKEEVMVRLIKDTATSGQWQVEDDGTVSSTYGTWIPNSRASRAPTFIYIKDAALSKGRLKFKFGKVAGMFNADKCKTLTTLEGFPLEAGQVFLPYDYNGSLEHLTRKPGQLFIMGITSLIGIGDRFDEVKKFSCSWDKITEGGIGLILIPGLKFESYDIEDMPEQFQIIAKYMEKPNEIFECQAELIEAGFEEYAKL